MIVVPAVALLRLAWAPQSCASTRSAGPRRWPTKAMEAQADPLDPTTGCFLHRFVVDHYSRRRGTILEYWERSV